MLETTRTTRRTIKVLRLGHRKKRDKRVTTHCALTARAFGANEIILSGERDDEIINTVTNVVKKWGGKFKIRYAKNWRREIKKFKKNGRVAHLTFYGLPLQEVAPELRKEKKLLIVIGASKVPREVYSLADWNVSVTNQPHSEVAALAVFLHEYFKGEELKKSFPHAEIRITPSPRGKIIRKIIKVNKRAALKAGQDIKTSCS